MKNKILLIGIVFSFKLNAQHNPTGSGNATVSPSVSNSSYSWFRGGNLSGGAAGSNNIFGTRWQSDIFVITNNLPIGQFTYGNFLQSITGDFGDGLRILAPAGSTGSLDLFTTGNSGLNETHARFGGSGIISGQRNRFEIISSSQMGMFYNTTQGSGIHRFSRSDLETGRIGTNNFWRIGMNSGDPVFGGINAARRLEVVDNQIQFRLTFSSTGSGPFTDFLSNSLGNLQIQPLGGRVGINASLDPTATLDVFGNVRIRDVQTATPNCLLIGVNANGASDVNVRRLDFTGNAGQALLGDGTWGTLPSGVNNAVNGTWINPSSGAVEWGTNPLNHNTSLNLATHNILFRTNTGTNGVITFGGQVYGSNSRVVINNDVYENGLIVNSLSSTTLGVKFGTYVLANNANRLTAIYGNATTGNTVQGIYGQASEGQNITVGVKGYGLSSAVTSTNIGGDFNAAGGNYTENIGARGYSNGSVKTNYGGKFKAGGSGSLSIGVYGECAPTNPTTGLVGYAGYFAGGVVTTGGTLWPSDSSLKNNITPLDTESDSLMQLLTPVSYEYNQSGDAARLNLAQGTKFGFLAQQVEQYFPNAVQTVTHPAEYDSIGNEIAPSFQYKAVDMSQLIPVMMSDLQRKSTIIQSQNATINTLNNSVQSLETQVTDLNNRLSQLENCLSGILPYLCQLSQSAVQANTPQSQEAIRTQLEVKLSNREAIILDQNVPNPFAEQTVINFSIPETVQKAQIHFYNGSGQLMQSVEVTERGLGSLTVFGSDLSSGTYTYTLVADGMVVATKKMVKQ